MKTTWSEAALAARRKKYAEDPVYRAYTLRYSALRRYKITPEQFDAHLAEQGGHCALCPAVGIGRSLHQDHDKTCCDKKFKCGKCNRGILCSHCNVAIGYLERFLSECEVHPEPIENTWLSGAMCYLMKYQIRKIFQTQENQA